VVPVKAVWLFVSLAALVLPACNTSTGPGAGAYNIGPFPPAYQAQIAAQNAMLRAQNAGPPAAAAAHH
jgi:hypothetical protein